MEPVVAGMMATGGVVLGQDRTRDGRGPRHCALGSAQACRVKRPHSGGAAPTHTARKTSVWRVCGSGLGRGREQRSGLNQRCIVTRAQSKGTNEWHTGEQDLIVLG